ncbi:hypothetical protein AB0K60_37320 [Thermopolyspora sp. NPDC052614]|uniref:hypothetical protein n=1 Tax=Thermopolyspora sp. NPDC052614 TaxID=3155682 RepID=UPI0034236684
MATRQPTAERSPADVVLGILAIVALLGLIAGVPYGLLRFFGSPIPEGGLSLSMLTDEVRLGTILDLLSILVWLAWLQLVACVIVELWAGIRNVGVPSRVPFAGGTQALAHRLVTAALLLFTAAAAVTPLVTASVQAKPAPVATAVADPSAMQQQAREDRALVPVKKAKKVYVVQPPAGRHHESLWEIADKCLGDGRRYKEVFELNKHRVQPDGTRLQISDLIRPGWVLDMPDDAINVHTVPADDDKAEILSGHEDKPSSLDGKTHHFDAKSDAKSDATFDAKSNAKAGADQGDPEDTREFRVPVSKDKPDHIDRPGGVVESPLAALPDFLAAASLAAAGLLAALGQRRRVQLWNRAFGRRLPQPEGDAALAEMALLLGADPYGTRLLDLGLRHLNRALAEQGRTPPTVYGTFLSPGHLDLWIHPADRDAPAPWVAVDNGSVWRLAAGDGHRLPEDALAGTLAPYPGMVSLGTRDGGRVLVDLEAAHGVINVRGRPHIVAAALAAVAVELATNRWSDHMRLILVGLSPDLALIAPDRVTVVPTLAEALPELEARTADVQRALAAAGVGSVLTGRCRGVYGEAWMPTYLLSAVPPNPAEATRLAELAKTGSRLASGYLVAGDDLPGAAWTWDLTPDGRASITALGLDVQGQLLPEQQYHQVIELFRTTVGDGVPMPDPEPSGPVSAQLSASFRPAAEVRVLGPIEVIAPGPIEDERRPICTELVCYLATHPGGVHPRVLGGALWPRGVEESVRDAVIARARDWLGTDRAGRPNLVTEDDGRLSLGPEVAVDWQIFLELARLAAADPHGGAPHLARALTVIRGPLLYGRPPGRYVWLAGDPLAFEVPARVADAAHRLSELRLAAADPRGGVDAALAGLRLADGDETLWRDLLRAAHAGGDLNEVRHWVDQLRRWAAASHLKGRLMPETEALIEELLPTPAYQQAG